MPSSNITLNFSLNPNNLVSRPVSNLNSDYSQQVAPSVFVHWYHTEYNVVIN